MKKIILCMLVGSLLLAACKKTETQTTTGVSVQNDVPIQSIRPVPFNDSLAAYPAGGAHLLDVRTSSEIKSEGAIANSTNIDFNEDGFDAALAKLDTKKPAFIYCAKGGRSMQTAEKLKKLGFTKIYNLEGGYEEWKKQMTKLQ